MSTTRKQIGSPTGYAKVDMESFSNPGQQSGNCGDYGVHSRGPTDPQFTRTGSSADGTVKDSAAPHVGKIAEAGGKVNFNVHVGTNSAVENRGK